MEAQDLDAKCLCTCGTLSQVSRHVKTLSQVSRHVKTLSQVSRHHSIASESSCQFGTSDPHLSTCCVKYISIYTCVKYISIYTKRHNTREKEHDATFTRVAKEVRDKDVLINIRHIQSWAARAAVLDSLCITTLCIVFFEHRIQKRLRE